MTHLKSEGHGWREEERSVEEEGAGDKRRGGNKLRVGDSDRGQ